jgi:hypothetical protein
VERPQAKPKALQSALAADTIQPPALVPERRVVLEVEPLEELDVRKQAVVC